MKLILFGALLFAFILNVIYPVRIGGVMGLTVPNIAIYCIGLMLIVSEFLSGSFRKKKIPGLKFVFLSFFGVILSLVYAQFYGVVDTPFLENARIAKKLVFEPALLYMSAFLLVDGREQGERYLLLAVIVLGVLNLSSVVGQELGVQVFREAEHYITEDVNHQRFSGFAGNPNKNAYLICVLLAFQYYFYNQYRMGLVKATLIIVMIFELTIVILSGSRGGLLMLVIAVSFLAYKLKDKRLIVGFIIIIPVLVGVLLISESTLLENAFTRMEYLTSGDADKATAGRTKIWGSLLSEYTDSVLGMLFGNGFGAAESMGIRARAHNLYIEVLIEFGVIGLGLFIYYIASTINLINKYVAGSDFLKYSVLAGSYVVAFAWLFSTLIGVLQLITFIWGLGVAALLTPVNKVAARKKTAVNLNKGIEQSV